MIRTIVWTGEDLRLLDQRRIPEETAYVACRGWRDVAAAIREMVVRGAPAIGAAAAYGMVLAAREAAARAAAGDPAPAPAAGARAGAAGGPADGAAAGAARRALEEAAAGLRAARPTAVNLFWALERMERAAARHLGAGGRLEGLAAALEAEARRIHEEDEAADRLMAEHGLALLPDGARVYTHCNTGALATAGWGTALGVVRAAHAAGRLRRVWVGETRPRLQGARLTAWELAQEGIPATLVTDSMAAALMAQGKVDAVLVGADRIAKNGDTANKIGTYALAVLARHHGVPFYVVAPLATVDPAAESGADIPIEERDPSEVTHVGGVRVAAEGVDVWNPAFDVTPAALIDAIVTERGVARAPYEASLAALMDARP
ncbi:MAG: S-methyl-5-thioribose-1-phosphate isomerase [Firmicutes bacterium]|nr:S-methyl-5-thioribose-1-phosphate isomerase [Bacillota bacterium]